MVPIVRYILTHQRLVLGGFAAIALSASLGFVWYYNAHHTRTIIPHAIKEKTLFPIYSPTYLPPHFSIDEQSFSIKDKTLVFQATNPEGQNLAITETALPAKLDFSSFYDKNLSSAKNLQGQSPYTTVMGTLKSNGRTVVSIQTTTTWILITTRYRLSQDEAAQLSRHLRKL